MFKKQVCALVLACAMVATVAPVMNVHAGEVIQVTDANSKAVVAAPAADAAVPAQAPVLEATATTNKNIVQVTDANSKNVVAAPAPAAEAAAPVATTEAAAPVAATEAAPAAATTAAMNTSGVQTTTPNLVAPVNTKVMSVR